MDHHHELSAEASVDERHLNQFQLVEFEHQGGFDMLLPNIEATVQAMIRNALTRAGAELEYLGRDMDELEAYLQPFNRISYTEAVHMLQDTPLEASWGEDLKAAHENYLVQATGGRLLFITHYPKEIKFFNMHQNDDDQRIVNSADLIMPYSGEAVGSAERENRHDLLVQRLLANPMFRALERRGKTIDDFKDLSRHRTQTSHPPLRMRHWFHARCPKRDGL